MNADLHGLGNLLRQVSRQFLFALIRSSSCAAGSSLTESGPQMNADLHGLGILLLQVCNPFYPR
jgi:hypothetical protein